MLDLISSGKQHNYTLYINYHKWTRNIKNNISLQNIYRVSEKHREKMGTFLQGYRYFINKYRDNIGCVKEKHLETHRSPYDTLGIGKGPVGLCTKMTKISVFYVIDVSLGNDL